MTELVQNFRKDAWYSQSEYDRHAACEDHLHTISGRVGIEAEVHYQSIVGTKWPTFRGYDFRTSDVGHAMFIEIPFLEWIENEGLKYDVGGDRHEEEQEDQEVVVTTKIAHLSQEHEHRIESKDPVANV